MKNLTVCILIKVKKKMYKYSKLMRFYDESFLFSLIDVFARFQLLFKRIQPKNLRCFLSGKKLKLVHCFYCCPQAVNDCVCKIIYVQPVIPANDISHLSIKSSFNKVFQEQSLRLDFYKQGTHALCCYYSRKNFFPGNKSTPKNLF